jgi:hypothetical protein
MSIGCIDRFTWSVALAGFVPQGTATARDPCRVHVAHVVSGLCRILEHACMHACGVRIHLLGQDRISEHAYMDMSLVRIDVSKFANTAL